MAHTKEVMKPVFAAAAAVLITGFGTSAIAQQGDGTDVSTRINVFKPAKVPATPERSRS